MAMPSKYRERLMSQGDGQLVVTVDSVDSDYCLLLYPLPEWEDIERKLVRLPTLNKQVRRLKRLLMGHATDCELDSSGRVLVPPPLRKFAELDRRIVLIGLGNKFEIWNEDIWTRWRDAELAKSDDGNELELPAELESFSY